MWYLLPTRYPSPFKRKKLGQKLTNAHLGKCQPFHPTWDSFRAGALAQFLHTQQWAYNRKTQRCQRGGKCSKNHFEHPVHFSQLPVAQNAKLWNFDFFASFLQEWSDPGNVDSVFRSSGVFLIALAVNALQLFGWYFIFMKHSQHLSRLGHFEKLLHSLSKCSCSLVIPLWIKPVTTMSQLYRNKTVTPRSIKTNHTYRITSLRQKKHVERLCNHDIEVHQKGWITKELNNLCPIFQDFLWFYCVGLKLIHRDVAFSF